MKKLPKVDSLHVTNDGIGGDLTYFVENVENQHNSIVAKVHLDTDDKFFSVFNFSNLLSEYQIGSGEPLPTLNLSGIGTFVTKSTFHDYGNRLIDVRKPLVIKDITWAYKVLAFFFKSKAYKKSPKQKSLAKLHNKIVASEVKTGQLKGEYMSLKMDKK